MSEKMINHEGGELPGNLAVITTKHVINDHAEIRLVVRDNDGDWQFLPHLEEISESDAFVIGLEKIISLDPSVIDTLKMPLGYMAWRADKSSMWQFCIHADE